MSDTTLPLLNAILNSIATTLLVTAWVLIRNRRYRAHGYTMAAAFLVSAVFLVSYVTHKMMFPDRSSGLEPGLLQYAYLFGLLMPHVILAMVMLPMIVATFWQTYRRQWDRHVWIARPTYWIWLYVSISGVAIYVLLYHVFPGMS